MTTFAQLNFYRRGIQELAAKCHDLDMLDLVYKLLVDGSEGTPPLQPRATQTEPAQRVEEMEVAA